MSDAVIDRINALLVGRFAVPEAELGPDVTFAELDLDSLALVEFALVAEQEFGVPIADDEVTPDATVRNAAELLSAKGVTV